MRFSQFIQKHLSKRTSRASAWKMVICINFPFSSTQDSNLISGIATFQESVIWLYLASVRCLICNDKRLTVCIPSNHERQNHRWSRLNRFYWRKKMTVHHYSANKNVWTTTTWTVLSWDWKIGSWFRKKPFVFFFILKYLLLT